MIVQFLVGLSLIVGIHELGHMLIAKMFGIRVDHYMIGFPPKIFKFKWGETEYALGALPMGGSAKIAGMVDETFDKKGLSSTPQPWEFRSKPTWQRLLVILGGVIFNMVSGIFIFIMILFIGGGSSYIPKEELNKYGVLPTELGKEIGIEEGDKILKVNGHDFKSFEAIQDPSILLKSKSYFTILRNNEEIEIIIPKTVLKSMNSSGSRQILVEPLIPYNILEVLKSNPAKQAGLKPGDIILSINDEKTNYAQKFLQVIKKYSGKKVSVKYLRDDTEYTTIMDIKKDGKIGIKINPLIKRIKEKYTFPQSIVKGTKLAFNIVWTNILAIKQMIAGNLSVSKSLKGPIGILQVFGGSFQILKFFYIVGFLSMMIAFTNLLPIPVLDGGHAVFIFYEMITGKKISEKILMGFQIAGTILFFLIILYTIINDIIKLF